MNLNVIQSTTWTSHISPFEDAAFMVIHLQWHPSARAGDEPHFLLWGETVDAAPPKRQRGRLAAKPRPKPHPFAIKSQGILRRLLQQFDPTLISQGSEPLTLFLPSTRTGPLPSPSLIHPWEIDQKAPRLEPWQIKALRLPLSTTVELLNKIDICECPERVVPGSDMRYWRQAFNLVLEALTQQLYVPTLTALESQADTYAATWRLVFDTDPFRESLIAMAQAMPPLCRSELPDDGEEPSALSLLKDFIQHTGDYLIRTWSNNAPHRITYLHNHNVTTTWLKSLLAEPAISGASGQIRTFASAVQTWQQNLAPAGNTTYTIALRLIPPPHSGDNNDMHVPEGGWRLEYMLQARDDPDLLVSAKQVWQAQEEALIYRQRRFSHPQEKLLKALGQAAHVFPPIERSLQEPTPTGVELATTEVYQFLREAAPLLEQSGFTLILPPWWEEAGTRLALRLFLTPIASHPPDLVGDPESGGKPIAYRWELVLGETTLTRETFADLVALRSPLVQKGNRWLRLDPEQIEAARHFWKRHSFEGRLDLQQALRAALGLDEHVDIAGLPIYKVVAESWLPGLIKRLGEGDEVLRNARQPAKLTGELRPYQRFGYAWLRSHRQLGLGACLADDMGLGKTIQTIALLLQEHDEPGHRSKPSLLVCPTSLLGNWRREFERFAPGLRIFTHYGADRAGKEAFAAVVSEYDVVLTSYTLARRDTELFHDFQWHGLILDEAQKIKNPNALTTQAIYNIPSQFRIALTGTPVENRLSELWSIFNFLNRGYLGSLSSFRKNFALPIERYHDPVAVSRLQRMARPFILRRLKSDPAVIQDLPERLDMKVYCTLANEQAALYQTVVEEGLPRIADSRGRARRIHVFNLLTRLKQILNHPDLYPHSADSAPLAAAPLAVESFAQRSGKLDRLTAMMEEVLDIGDRALVFTQFAETGNLLATYLQEQFDRPVFYMHGGVPTKRRQEMVMRFQEDPYAPHIFVLTLGTGGLGLNLTAANHVFHFDRWWNPAVEDQASDRTYRIGQTRNVQIHKFITAGTVEEAIDEMIERKRGLAEAIVGSDEGWVANLSDDELADIVQLRNDRI